MSGASGKKTIKKKSVSRRVVITTVTLFVLSLMGVYLNQKAIVVVGDYTTIYDDYSKLQLISQEAKVAYTEAQMYVNIAFFREGEDNAASILGIVQKKTEIMDSKCDEIDNLSKGLKKATVTGASETDEELISVINSWTEQLREYSSQVSEAATDGINGKYESVYAIGEKQEGLYTAVTEAETAFEEKFDERLDTIELSLIHI